MFHYKYMIIVTGAITIVYIMLKLLQNKPEESGEKKSDSEVKEEPKEEVLATTKTESQKKCTKRKKETPKRAMKMLRPKPNFFVAFQVNDVGIHQKVKKLQEKLLVKNPSLFPAIVNVSTLHVTLAVTHLASEADIKTARDKLDEWKEKNINKYFGEPCILNFTGVKTFNNVVAYVNLEQNENYKKILDVSQNINSALSSAGFSVDSKSFTPHLTFLKLSKDFKLLRTKKHFISDFEFLKQNDEHFGEQEVSHLQLLSMDDPKDEFGYYKCYYQIKVSDICQNSDHSECCKPIENPNKSAEKCTENQS